MTADVEHLHPPGEPATADEAGSRKATGEHWSNSPAKTLPDSVLPEDHILDPRAGYRLPHGEDDIRVDYRRVELGSLIALAAAAVEISVNLVRNVTAMWGLIAVALICAPTFWTLARRAQRSRTHGPPFLVESFVIFALLSSSGAGYLAGLEGRLTSGYSLTFLTVSAFYMIPPRRFIAIGVATYAFYVAWLSSLDLPLLSKVFPLTNTGFAVLAGCFARSGIDRIQQVGRLQRRQIAERNAALSRQVRELNDLMAIAAHDLRSPLFGLANLLDLARHRPPASPEGMYRLLDAAGRSVTAMLALVGRLLDVHEVEGRAAPAIKCKDLGVLLAASVQRVEPLARAAGVEIKTVIPDQPVLAWGDADNIGQILDNLLSNAVRYSSARSTVRITAGLADDHAFIEVADQGVGVPTGERSMLFAKFRRGSTPPPSGSRGSGLGLYIVKILAQTMGAECTYSPNPSGGSIFRLTFQTKGLPSEVHG
jgi:signal transduction histidine kinase